MSNKLAITKLVINAISSAGVSKVVNGIIRNNVAVESPTDVVTVWAGSVVLGSMVADAATSHLYEKIDGVANWWEAHQTENTKNEYVSDR